MRDIAVILGLLLVAGCVNEPQWTPTRIVSIATTQPATAASSIVVPMELLPHGLPAVVLAQSGEKVDSKELSFALIDTGSIYPMLTEEYARSRKLRIEQSPTLVLMDAFGQTKHTPYIGHLPSLDVGDARLEKFDAVVVDVPGMRDFSSHLAAILAAPTFRDCLLTLDYPNRKLILQPGGALPEPNGKDILALRRTEQGHLKVPLTIMGEQAWLTLDTGYASEGLLLSRYRLIGLPWAALPTEGNVLRGFLSSKPVRIGRMDGQIAMGGYTLRRPILAVSYRDDDELLGADVLRHFVVTIDQKNLRVRFESPEQTIDWPSVRRLGFTMDAQGIVKLSPAKAVENNVLHDGDQMLECNGRPVDKLDYRYWELFEQRGEPLNVRVMREGKELSLRVPIEVVVP